MGLLSQGMESLSLASRTRRSSSAVGHPKDKEPRDSAEDDADTSTLDKDEGNLLMALISQRE
jgi:hypothetical protein